MFTLIFTSSFLFSRFKKTDGLQRIYLVVYKLFVIIIIIIIRICEFDVLWQHFLPYQVSYYWSSACL